MVFSSLPEEIQVDIFLKLPANSILKCRCVCKGWYSLLFKPKFIKYHLNQTILNSKHNQRLMVIGYGLYRCPQHVIYSTDYASVFNLSSRTPSIHFPFEYNENICSIELVGSCNGLVCLVINSQYDANGVDNTSCICLWNPCTREYKKIQIPSLNNFSSVYMRHNIGYGFGYDSKIEDYKLVCIPYTPKVLVFNTLGSDSWKSTQTRNSYVFPNGRLKAGLLFNGALHWSCHNKETFNPVIVSFDISDETLNELPFPEPYRNMKGSFSYMSIRLGVLDDSLCLVCSRHLAYTDTWVMRDYGVTCSWTKLFTTTHITIGTSYSYVEPIWSFKNGEILMNSYERLFLINSRDGGLVMSCSIPGSDHRVYRLKSQCYVESLVSVNSGTYVDKNN